MKLISYGVRTVEESFFHSLNSYNYQLTFVQSLLNTDNISLAKNHDIVMVRGNCVLSYDILKQFKEFGIKGLLTRTVGYDHIDLQAVKDLGFELCARVPAYSPNAISELTVSLALGLYRNTFAMLAATHQGDFKAYDLYLSREIRYSTVGILGMGRIGIQSAKAFNGLGARVLAYDVHASDEGKTLAEYVELDYLLQESDIVILHMPYIKDKNYHFVNKDFFSKMKDNSFLINTSRGELVNLSDLLEAIKSHKIAGAGLDVVEGEGEFFFQDLRGQMLPNQVINELFSFYPRVVVTPHLGSFTTEALTNMIEISYQNLQEFLNTEKCQNNLI